MSCANRSLKVATVSDWLRHIDFSYSTAELILRKLDRKQVLGPARLSIRFLRKPCADRSTKMGTMASDCPRHSRLLYATAEQNFTKHDRKQAHNDRCVPYQVCVCQADPSRKMFTLASDWHVGRRFDRTSVRQRCLSPAFNFFTSQKPLNRLTKLYIGSK